MSRPLVAFIAVSIILLAPQAVFAASTNFFGPIVPDGTNGQLDCNCPGSAPSWGCVLQTVQNAISFGVSMGAIIITLVIAYAGILFIANPTNPGQREQGRAMVMNAIIGLVIVLCAWLLVDFVMKALYNGSEAARVTNYTKAPALPWNAIISDESDNPSGCLVVQADVTNTTSGGGVTTVPGGQAPSTSTAVGSGGTLSNSCTASDGTAKSGPDAGKLKSELTCANCVKLEATCKSSSSCNLTSSVASKINSLWNSGEFSGTWRVTEAFPSTICTHSNSCHYTGTCIDAGFSGTSYTLATVKDFIQAASSAGLRAVLETTDCDLRDSVRNAGYSAYCKSDSGYSGMTVTHFSVYAN